MRLHSNADLWAGIYFAGLDAMAGISALDLRMIHAEHCQQCGGGPRTRIVGRFLRGQREWHEVCASCRRPWQPEPWGDRCVLRGEIQANSRPGGTEDRMLELAMKLSGWRRVRPLIEPRPERWTQARWNETLLWWRAWLPPVHATYSGIAEVARVGSSTVEKRLRFAREHVERKAKRSEHRRAAA